MGRNRRLFRSIQTFGNLNAFNGCANEPYEAIIE